MEYPLMFIILLLCSIIFILITKAKKTSTEAIELNEVQKGLLRHDLKVQLGRILALSNLITLSSANFSPEQKEYLRKIEVECNDGIEMINNSMLKKNNKKV
jgi:hypothetical protein